MEVPISSISVGERRREDYGDISQLARSIEKYGLLHPVVVDSEWNLIAGGRRLEACREMGWTHLPITNMGDLTPEELREMELEENLQRKDLTPYEQARELVRKAERVAPVISTKLVEKAPQGRKSEYEVPKRDVAEAVGSSTMGLVRAEQHVAIAEEFPVFQSADWSQSQALEARKALAQIDAIRRQPIVGLISEKGVPADIGLRMLQRFAACAHDHQADLAVMIKHGDEVARMQVTTFLADVPPMPDFRISILSSFLADLRRCLRDGPQDSAAVQIAELVRISRMALSELKGNANGKAQ